jgi:arylsulfatase A-like enzyme
MKRSLGHSLFVWLCLPFCMLACGAPEPPPRHPIRNVVLVSIDTLGALHSSAYGYGRETTPALEIVAAGGTLFRNAYSHQVWTLTSHLTMMTGLYPQAHGASHQRPATAGVASLAELLRDAGFTTAAFTGIKGFMRPEFGLGRGFTNYELGHPHRPGRYNGMRMPWLEQQARKKKRDPDHRFFMFVHSFDVHADKNTEVPYYAPPPYDSHFLSERHTWDRKGGAAMLSRMSRDADVTTKDKRTLAALYDNGVVFTDHQVIAPLFAKLQSLDLWDDTLLVITADHGEELFAHGFPSHQQPYEETARVPLIFHGPGIPEGLKVDKLVGLADLMPTLLSLLDLATPEHVQGRDLSPLMRGEQIDRDTVFVDGLMGGLPSTFAHYASSAVAEIDGERWSLVAKVDPGPADAIAFAIEGSPELYCLSRDPRQQRNIIEQHPEIASELASRLLAWYAENRALQLKLAAAAPADSPESEAPILSEEDIAALEALGYIAGDSQ